MQTFVLSQNIFWFMPKIVYKQKIIGSAMSLVSISESCVHPAPNKASRTITGIMHPTLGSLATSQAFFYAVSFFCLDSFPSAHPLAGTPLMKNTLRYKTQTFRLTLRAEENMKKTNEFNFMKGPRCRIHLIECWRLCNWISDFGK